MTLAQTRRYDQIRDRTAQGLRLSIAKRLFGRRIEILDQSVGIHRNQGVERRFKNRTCPVFTFSEVIIDPLLLRYVNQHVDRADDGAGGITDWVWMRHHVPLGSVRSFD